MKVNRVRASFLLLASILLGGASVEKSSDTIVEEKATPIKLSKKVSGCWK